eukprot:TRINITY_DN49181_c0_g1_i1.p1 TRINITY_DN49181_c0_g1~~TRINITY_DN49181_c0_g1_i1.p1  ORF type:complete len:418 (-),score=68.65 TRINITY_DN49181_c0_g1_i1:25-1278(-)
MSSRGSQASASTLTGSGNEAADEAGPRFRGAAQTSASEAEVGSEKEAPRQARGDMVSERCRRILLSPAFKAGTLSIVSVVPVFGNLVALPVMLEKLGCTGLLGWLIRILAFWISVQFLYNFASSQFTDPGSCADVQPTRSASGQFEMASSDVKLLYAPNWCQHCKHWKPPRAHHCSFCRRCVLRMDHHCPFTGNCIGIRNQGHFVLMYVFAMIGLLLSLTLCILVILAGIKEGKLQSKGQPVPVEKSFRDAPILHFGFASFVTSLSVQILEVAGLEIACQTLFSAVAFIAVCCFGCPALHLASTGSTLLEYNFPMKEYVQLQPTVYCPLGPGFYRHSLSENLKDLIGKRWWLRLLLPVRGGVLDCTPAIHPKPSPEGVIALQERIKQVEENGVTQTVKNVGDLGIDLGPRTAGDDDV